MIAVCSLCMRAHFV